MVGPVSSFTVLILVGRERTGNDIQTMVDLIIDTN